MENSRARESERERERERKNGREGSLLNQRVISRETILFII